MDIRDAKRTKSWIHQLQYLSRDAMHDEILDVLEIINERLRLVEEKLDKIDLSFG